MKLSLITIFNGRRQHLENQLTGITANNIFPDEIIIIGINEDFQTTDFPELPIKFKNIKWEGKHLPIAKARNLGAQIATNELLVFLDVDCIPSQTFIEAMNHELQTHKGCIMGNPYYLEYGANDNNLDLEENSEPHPARPDVKALTKYEDYNLFWSLCFGIQKEEFMRIGGFDENFEGYGGEDTDFAWNLEKYEVPFYLSPHKVYHQQHPVYSPPLNHIDPILNNAIYFRKKWGKWIMENWLEAFSESAYIEWNKDEETLKKLKDPTAGDLKTAYKARAKYM